MNAPQGSEALKDKMAADLAEAIPRAPSRAGSLLLVNPVEGLVLIAVLGGFTYSIIGLFNERDTFTTLMKIEEGSAPGLASLTDKGGARKPASSQLVAGVEADADRDPASTQSTAGLLRQFDFRCDLSGEQSIEAGKVRLSGPFCSGTGGISADSPIKTAILNEANQFTATVFMDGSTGRFSTDYIPLTSGSNPIAVEFRYANGASVKKSFTLLKK
jgi:hypothetical protein